LFSLERHYALHSEQIYQFIYFLTFDKELTEDLLQETFIRAYEGRANYRGDANVLSWLRSIAKNLTYDYFKRKKIIRFLPFTSVPEPQTNEQSILHTLQVEEQQHELYIEIAKLRLEYRTAIILRKIEGLSIKETADILGWSEAKVKNNTIRGLKALSHVLKDVNDDD
jgi:RNA polymerase sigma-70 factor, ECF subfamily